MRCLECWSPNEWFIIFHYCSMSSGQPDLVPCRQPKPRAIHSNTRALSTNSKRLAAYGNENSVVGLNFRRPLGILLIACLLNQTSQRSRPCRPALPWPGVVVILRLKGPHASFSRLWVTFAKSELDCNELVRCRLAALSACLASSLLHTYTPARRFKFCALYAG
jgi:hypothetical protein